MKRITAFLLGLTLLLGLAACGINGTQNDAPSDTSMEQTPETRWSAEQMAQAILESQEEPTAMRAILPGDEFYDAYITETYQLNPADITEAALLCAEGTSAQEIAVLHTPGNAETVAERLRNYVQTRIGAFAGYLPEEEALLEDAVVITQGNWTALLACQDTQDAEAAFRLCFEVEPPSDDASTSSQNDVQSSESQYSAEAAELSALVFGEATPLVQLQPSKPESAADISHGQAEEPPAQAEPE